MGKISQIYKTLLKAYGPQGWWPILSVKGKNPTKTGAVKGYHPEDYSYPKNDLQRFEICIGAILTQNTAWPNAEKALVNLKKIGAINPAKILAMNEDKLKEAIKPAGYYNQKAKKLKIFTEYYLSLKGKTPSRQELLNVWGVGPETADSILLYAFCRPVFVVDAYTKRIFSRLGVFNEKASYGEIQEFFHKHLKPDTKAYNEFHALIVEHAKRHCTKKAACTGCKLHTECKVA